MCKFLVTKVFEREWDTQKSVTTYLVNQTNPRKKLQKRYRMHKELKRKKICKVRLMNCAHVFFNFPIYAFHILYNGSRQH